MRSSADRPSVHLLAGLNGAGKTVHARRLEGALPAVRFTLDEWMLRLYGLPFDDERYPPLAERCRELIWDLARQVLRTGNDVVLDWNHWSRERRAESGDKARAAGGTPVLHYVTVPVGSAIAQAQARARTGDGHAHVLDADGIRHLASIFEEPSGEEGMELRVVTPPAR